MIRGVVKDATGKPVEGAKVTIDADANNRHFETKTDKKGPVLVFGAQLADKSWVLGAGFVPKDDTSDADKAILTAIESIGPTPPAAAP